MLRRPSLVLLSSALSLVAGGWAPIPSDVWAIHSGPKGAVILEDHIRFRLNAMDHVYRVRIFSEEGRTAAELPDMGGAAYSVEGRTVYPDGRQVVFNSAKDLTERTSESAGYENRKKHLVVPGVTSDCVVEVTWSEPSDGPVRGLPRRFHRGYYSRWDLETSVPTKLRVIEVAKVFPMAWSLDPGTGPKPESSEQSGYRVVTFHDLPGREEIPYTLDPLLHMPSLVVFYQPDDLRYSANHGPDAYWPKVVEDYVKPAYEDGISKGSDFRKLAAELLAGLPATPVERATELLVRLNEKVANLDSATYAESASLPKDFWNGFESKDLGWSARARKTDASGMRLLFYHLLKEAKVAPKIGYVVDRDQAFFAWGVCNTWQFDHELIGVDLPGGGILWLDPTLRFAAPGLVHPDYTGVSMLEVDSSDWKATRAVIPVRPPEGNQRNYTYTLDLTDEGDQVDLVAGFTGFPEYSERATFMSLDAKEQGRTLRERFEKAMKNLVVSEASVANATEAGKPVTWHLKGSLEREPGRFRVVDPFPGMPWPLSVPSKLDADRKVPIVLPYLSTQTATSQFQVPKGYQPHLQEAIHQANEFGQVVWEPVFDSATGKVTVTLRIQVSSIFRGPGSWDAFRTFLGWIETACRREISLAKEG